MFRPCQRVASFSVLATCLCLAAWIGLANAEETSVPLKKEPALPTQSLRLTPPANATAEEPLPLPSKSVVEGASQQTEQSLQVAPKDSFLRPAEPRRRVPATTALSVTDEPMPAPEPEMIVEEPEFEVRPTPPIEYDTDRDARKMFRKSGEVQVMMIAKNPADGCHYEIPMCIPGCCIGEPQVSGGQGLFGRGVVEFCWECGFRAKVKFRHILGDVKVEYEGD